MNHSLTVSSWALALCASATLVGTAFAAAPRPSEAQQRYQEERAACQSMASAEDRRTCLREAGAALQAARKGNLTVANESEYEKNRLARCDMHPAGERELCLRMMKGEGTMSGSVEGGGIIRELAVTEVGGVESPSGVGAGTQSRESSSP